MLAAVCDDNKDMAQELCKKIKEIDPEIETFIFTNGNELLRSDKVWDIVFLDLEMGDMHGFCVAEELNKQCPDCVLAFVTTHMELAVDGYDYSPFRYILKTAPEPVIKRKIFETVSESYRINRVLSFSYKGKHNTVKINDIQWIETIGHGTKIVLADYEVECGKTLNEIEKELQGFGFVRCHRSYIVAVKNVKIQVGQDIHMKNDSIVPLGRQYRKEFKKQYVGI